jgi:hypothetical protein
VQFEDFGGCSHPLIQRAADIGVMPRARCGKSIANNFAFCVTFAAPSRSQAFPHGPKGVN